MAQMNVFQDDAFSVMSMMSAIDKVGFVPSFLGSIPGLFDPNPVYTEEVWIESRENAPALILTSARGTPPRTVAGERRQVRGFKSVRVAESDRIHAAQVQNIRAFGSEGELQSIQVEVARRQFIMRRNMELTLENMRLGAVQGLVKDADNSTLFDWATEFGQAIPGAIDFDLDNASPASGIIRKKCAQVIRSVLRALKGLGGSSVQLYALCGDAFFDDLIAHPEVRQTFLNYTAAAELRDAAPVFQMFPFGGITWINYRGTDDGTTVSVPTDTAKIFPANAGIFKWCMSPAERMEFVNTLGQPVYTWLVPDKDRNMYVDVEMYSYPLPVCTMPGALQPLTRT